MMADKDTERAKANGQAKGESKGEGPKDAQVAPLDEPPADPLVDQATDPNVIDPVVWILIFALFLVCPCLGLVLIYVLTSLV